MATNNAINTNIPIPVASGGTGAASLTAHSLLLGEGTGAVTALGAATNGQLAIGSTGSDPVLATITAGTGITITNGAGTITTALTTPVTVANGGTGAATFTAHSLLVGEGTSAFTALGSATNGQLPIGSTGADPVLATITAGTGITVTNGAGTITIASSGGGVSSLAGNSGGALTGALSLVTADSNVTFVGSGSTITLDFAATTNTVLGNSLASLSSGVHNVGLGSGALNALSSGNSNTAIGYQAGTAISTTGANTYIGALAGNATTTGSSNTAIGFGAGGGFTTGTNNICIGANTTNYTSSESSNILMNNGGTNGESHACRIGSATGTGSQQLNKTFIAGIQTITVTGTAVLVSSSDQLGVAASSKRFKLDIKDMGSDSSTIYNLRPVTFIWDKNAAPGLKDAPDSRQFGLIAEEVVRIMPDIVQHDKDLVPFTVQYEKLMPMLLNEIQRLNQRLITLEAKLK